VFIYKITKMPLPATTRNSKLSRSRPAGREDSKDGKFVFLLLTFVAFNNELLCF